MAIVWHKAGDAKPTPSCHSMMTKSCYDIVNSWILDSGSNIHVCNDSRRFKPTHTTTSEDYLVSGSTTYQIEAYGTVDITITTPNGSKRNTTLHNVALVPSFFTNLVSFSRIMGAGIYWDTRKSTLFTIEHGIQNDFCSLTPHNGYWIVEYNRSTTSSVMYASTAASNNILVENCQKDLSALSLTAGGKVPAPIASAAAAQHRIKELTPTQLH